MRTRIAFISVEEDNDGRKRVVRKAFPAEALLLLDPPTAGEGFLTIIQALVNELDGVAQAAPAPPAPPASTPIRSPEEIAQITTKRKTSKAVDKAAAPA